MAYVIAEPCIGTKDTACVDACPVDCIHPKKDEDGFEATDQLFIDPVECIDCGACVPACPVSAIFAADDLPEKWAHFAEKNSTHYGRSAAKRRRLWGALDHASFFERAVCTIRTARLCIQVKALNRNSGANPQGKDGPLHSMR